MVLTKVVLQPSGNNSEKLAEKNLKTKVRNQVHLNQDLVNNFSP